MGCDRILKPCFLVETVGPVEEEDKCAWDRFCEYLLSVGGRVELEEIGIVAGFAEDACEALDGIACGGAGENEDWSVEGFVFLPFNLPENGGEWDLLVDHDFCQGIFLT